MAATRFGACQAEMQARITEAERDAEASMMQVQLSRSHLSHFSAYSSMMELDADGGAVPTPMPKILPLTTYFAFVSLGMGTSWLLCDALFLQVPYLEMTQPEGMSLASLMTVCINVGNVAVLLFFILHRFWPHDGAQLDEILMVSMICLGIASLLLAALFWRVQAGGYSIVLLVAAAVGGSIGALRNTVQIPWLLAYDNRLVSASVLGSACADALVAVIALVQRPASDARAFGPTTFFVITAVMAAPSLLAFAAIKRYRLGKLPATPEPAQTEHAAGVSARAVMQQASSLSTVREHGIGHSSTWPTAGAAGPAASASTGSGISNGVGAPGKGAPGDAGQPSEAGMRAWRSCRDGPTLCDSFDVDLAAGSTGDGLTIDARPRARGLAGSGGRRCCGTGALPEWSCRAARLFLLFALVQAVVWGITPGLLPYAAQRVADAHGGWTGPELLQFSVSFSYLGLVAGSWLSLLRPLFAVGRQSGLVVLCALVQIVLAFDTSLVLAPYVPAWLLVTSVFMMRALDGFTTSMIFRSVSVDERYGDKQEFVQRGITLSERVSTPIGATVVYAVVRAVLQR